MKHYIRVFCLFFIFLGCGFAQDLEIKVNNKPLKLPYWPAQKSNHGGVIIVRGGDPIVWSDSLARLAQILADSGLSTVLINCSPDIKEPWLTQLPEVISTLRQNKNKRIVLTHYGEQLNMTLEYLSKKQAKAINALVLLSAYDEKESAVKLSSLHFPMFDITGQFDYSTVKEQAKARQSSVQLPLYFFMEIPGADHDFNYAQELLGSFLSGWMLKIRETSVAEPPIKASSLLVRFYIEPIFPRGSMFVATKD